MGEDPAERKRQEREGDTLADVAARYLDDLKARAEAGAKRGRLSGWESAAGLWRRHVPAAMKRRKVAAVTVEDVRRVHRRLSDRAATADHVRTVLHAILETARTEGLIDNNPAAVVQRYSKPSQRRRALTLEELARLGKVLDAVEAGAAVTVADEDGGTVTRNVDPAAALTLRLLALTGMRKSELLGHQSKARGGPREGLRWADVDLKAGSYELASALHYMRLDARAPGAQESAMRAAMSGSRSRRKGKRGERELAAALRAEGFDAHRGAQHRGGPDSPDVLCPSLPRIHFEVKRTERLRLYDAIAQAHRDAGDKLPVVAHRRNACEWLAILRLSDLLAILRESDLTKGGIS